MKIMHIIDTLAYHGSARQLQLLAPALADEHTSVEVCCLGPDTSGTESLRRAGMRVHTLGWTRWFDPGVPLSLRTILREACPDIVHVWRPTALRMLAVAAREWLPRVVMSAPLPSKGEMSWWDRQLMRRVGVVSAAGPNEQARCIQAGATSSAVRIMPLAVARAEETTPDPAAILWMGRFERAAGGREAIVAFDFLRRRFTHMRLRLLGAGIHEETLRALVSGLESQAVVSFLGAHGDTYEHLRQAALVWIPSLANVGRQVALEAMAHGRAIVAFDVPCLRDVIVDRETGFLVPVGDIVQMARRSRDLLMEPALRARMGDAARRHVETRWPLAQTVVHWRDLYRSL